VIAATAVALALTLWAKGATLSIVRARLDADYARKFGAAL
jgi:hypothetical protein